MANLGCDEDDDDDQLRFMTMMEGVPHDPLKPRPTPFDDMDLGLLWDNSSCDGKDTFQKGGDKKKEEEVVEKEDKA